MATDLRPSLPIIDHTPEPYTGPSRDQVLALRHQYLSPGIITYYREPLMVVEGHMQYVWDESGRRYLDAFAGIVTISVGHCHPKVVERVREQTGRLQHTTTIYLHPAIVQMAEKLAEKMPPGLTRSYFTNSGSEANEIAVLSAREYTGNQDVIALRNGYHGGTSVPMSLTAEGTWKFKSNNNTNVHHTLAGYCYRCPFGLEYPSCGVKCAHDIKNVIQFETPGEIVGRPKKPNVMFDGYWGRPEATAQIFRNLWMHSGDIGRFDADGFLYFMDRKADYMRRRGENVSSYELEEVFIRHPDVADVAVYAVPSPVTEDDIMVAVELVEGSSLTEESLYRWSIEAIPYFALPRYIEIRDELPRSEMKKVLKAQLREEGVGPNTWDADESGINCVFNALYDTLGIAQAAGAIHELVAQCAASPAAPICEFIRTSGGGAIPDRPRRESW